MEQFLLTLRLQLSAHEPIRMFPQDHIPELESWSHLKELIPVACDRVRRENPQYGDPRQFTVKGSTFIPNRRGEGGRELKKLLEMAITYNPLTDDFTVNAASFDRSLEDIEEDMHLELGDPLIPPFNEESVRESPSLSKIDILKLPPEAEPRYPPNLSMQRNEWMPQRENWIPKRADEEKKR